MEKKNLTSKGSRRAGLEPLMCTLCLGDGGGHWWPFWGLSLCHWPQAVS